MTMTEMVTARLASSRSVLLAGCGGGYDVFGAVPLVQGLRAAGKRVHLASLSFTYLNGLSGARQVEGVPNLYEVPASAADTGVYCPEAWLARTLGARLGGDWPVWCFDKTGVQPLLEAYRWLIRTLDLDAIVLLDGGIDALLRGDETSIGTPAEDLCSLAAVHRMPVPTRLLACLGMGSEWRDGICHEQALARVAEMTAQGAFLGASPVLLGTSDGDLYRDAVEDTFAGQSGQRQSHVHRVVLAAMRGEHGEVAPHVWLNPLLPFVWWFDLPAVTRSHLFLDRLTMTRTIWDVHTAVEAARHDVKVRAATQIPF